MIIGIPKEIKDNEYRVSLPPGGVRELTRRGNTVFVEITHATTRSNQTYFVDDVLHYGVANLPGAVPRTSSYALSNATLRYAIKLAGGDLHEVLASGPALAKG